jgi:hypothetical protein
MGEKMLFVAKMTSAVAVVLIVEMMIFRSFLSVRFFGVFKGQLTTICGGMILKPFGAEINLYMVNIPGQKKVVTGKTIGCMS